MHKHLGDLIYQSNKELVKAVNRRLASMNMGYSQLQILMTIVKLGDGNEVDQEVLAEMMQVDKSNVSRNLSKMHKDGLIRIIQSEQDRRKKRILLTQRGQHSIHDLKAILNEINQKMTAELDVVELQRTMKYLNQVIKNLEDIE